MGVYADFDDVSGGTLGDTHFGPRRNLGLRRILLGGG